MQLVDLSIGNQRNEVSKSQFSYNKNSYHLQSPQEVLGGCHTLAASRALCRWTPPKFCHWEPAGQRSSHLFMASQLLMCRVEAHALVVGPEPTAPHSQQPSPAESGAERKALGALGTALVSTKPWFSHQVRSLAFQWGFVEPQETSRVPQKPRREGLAWWHSS